MIGKLISDTGPELDAEVSLSRKGKRFELTSESKANPDAAMAERNFDNPLTPAEQGIRDLLDQQRTAAITKLSRKSSPRSSGWPMLDGSSRAGR